MHTNKLWQIYKKWIVRNSTRMIIIQSSHMLQLQKICISGVKHILFIFLSFLVPVLVVSGIYHGGIVDVTPEIRAENEPICGYRVVNTQKEKFLLR